jgi:hypothetical protein
MAQNLNSNTKKALEACIENDDLNSLIKLIESKNVRTCGKYALEKALEGQNLEIAMALVMKGVDINTESSNGFTTLMLASCMGNNPYVAQLITDRRINLNSRRRDGSTALMITIQNGHVEIAQQLLQADLDLDVNCANDKGMTALMMAANGCHLEIVKLLLGKDVDTFAARYRDGANALTIALKAMPHGNGKASRDRQEELMRLIQEAQRRQASARQASAGGGSQAPKRKTRRAKKNRRSKTYSS